MPLRKSNTRSFHKKLYAGELETITLLKRDNNFRAMVITKYTLFNCRMGQITKSGEQLDNDQTSNMRRTLHIPREELDRVGVQYLKALDTFIDSQNRFWQAQSDTTITGKLWENHYDVECVRIDPPKNPITQPVT